MGGWALLRFVIQFLIPIALAIFAVVDCVLTPPLYVRALPKSVWILLILVPYVGALLWIFTGRGVTAPAARGRRSTDLRGGPFAAFTEPGTHERRPSPAPRPEPTGRPLSREWSVAPDDDPEFLRKLGEQMRKDRPEG
jgi:hypothetical protein